MLFNDNNTKDEWSKQEQRIRRIIISIIVMLILLVLICFFFGDVIWTIIAKLALIVSLIIDVVTLNNIRKGSKQK